MYKEYLVKIKVQKKVEEYNQTTVAFAKIWRNICEKEFISNYEKVLEVSIQDGVELLKNSENVKKLDIVEIFVINGNFSSNNKEELSNWRVAINNNLNELKKRDFKILECSFIEIKE